MDKEALHVELTVDAQVVRVVEVRSSRHVHAAGVFTGKSVEDASRLVPLLFALCGRAQSEAAHRAFDHMTARAPSESEGAARSLLVDAEAIDQHLQAILLAWPQAQERPPEMEAYLPLRRHLGKLEGLLGAGGYALGTRSRKLEPSPDLAMWGRTLRAMVDPLAAFDGAPARALESQLDPGMAAAGPADTLARPEALLSALRANPDPAFSARPTLEGGRPAEVGSLAQWKDDPRLSECVAVYGPGILARCLARLLDVQARLDAVDDALGRLAAESADVSHLADLNGRAVGQVNTARGPLHHEISVEQGLVASWRVVAPTEWSFHPRGTLASLLGVHRDEAEATGRWLLTSLDPCVPHTLTIVEDSPES